MGIKEILSKKTLKEILGGDELRKIRDEFCYSQEYMAKKIGLTQSTYQRLESGKIRISKEHQIKIAEIFNLSIESFRKDNQTEEIFIKNKEIALLQNIISQLENRILELENTLRTIVK
ncbi:helix-turn-helix transcriptional regulator [Pedobacter polaris]|uniref:Helix-turn-helix transcriptional regulator n=1 Tax=Pedobacter polaris TaxID=2571273 RepID=A0A4U1CXJ2_9SPHI|nr:helix-turn-helix transcriptional regulator [Pedobacter polaris]TKC13125.1 helix-turn-helix transcriptional regulator [Pedobacter polaris]